MTATRLSTVNSSGHFRCLDIEGTGDAVVRLKQMGICSGRLLKVVQAGDPMVLLAVGTRIGVSRKLAECVLVEPVLPASVPMTQTSDQPVLCGAGSDV
ncbi:MAG: ferrous iron transport protein A [Planctomycetaceae bacterium]|nr:ferrous iron transport protein A [Planctomycetaceae bacterium]